MNRFVSILALISLLCNAVAASSEALLLCSHEDGQGHVVEFSEHEKQHSDPCHDHQDSHKSDSAPESSHADALCEFESQSCEDVEVPQSDFQNQSQNRDRHLLKSPAIYQCLYDRFLAKIDRQTEIVATRDKDAPALESASRRFAKTIQIRC